MTERKKKLCGASHHSFYQHGNSVQRQEPPLLLPLTNIYGYVIAYMGSPREKVPVGA